MIHNETSLEDRKLRSLAKDYRFKKMINSLKYKDEGELFLKNLQNNCLAKLIKRDNYEVI